MSERPSGGPAYYTRLEPQPVEVIEAWGLSFNRGAVVKYIARAGHKPGADELDDLRKALWFIEREIERVEAREVRASLIWQADTEPAPPADCCEVIIVDDADIVPDAAPTQPDTLREGAL